MPEAEFTEGHHVERHRDGSVRARGPVVDGQPDGYWEWFRLDGTMLRSGSFDRGRQTGEWTTYDRSGAPYKVTTIEDRPKA
jgi:antitoxin component YwqK of YwqJK toxin-antitoxin module